jgi:hypothetical protein
MRFLHCGLDGLRRKHPGCKRRESRRRCRSQAPRTLTSTEVGLHNKRIPARRKIGQEFSIEQKKDGATIMAESDPLAAVPAGEDEAARIVFERNLTAVYSGAGRVFDHSTGSERNTFKRPTGIMAQAAVVSRPNFFGGIDAPRGELAHPLVYGSKRPRVRVGGWPVQCRPFHRLTKYPIVARDRE